MIGTVLVILPLVDLAANAWPWAPGALTWRYGGYTLLSGFLTTPVVGLALLAGAAVVAGQRTVGRVVAVVGIALVVGLIGATALFVLDALQLGATVPAEAATQFRIGVAKALFKNLAMAGALTVVAWVAWRRSGRHPRRPPSGTDRGRVPLVGSS